MSFFLRKIDTNGVFASVLLRVIATSFAFDKGQQATWVSIRAKLNFDDLGTQAQKACESLMDLTNIELSLRSEHSQESYYDSRTCEALVLCSALVNLKKIKNVT